MLTRTLLTGLAAGTVAVSAHAANIAPTGTAGLGYTDDTATAGTLRNHIGANVDDPVVASTRLTDGDTSVTAGTTTVDTWAGGGTLAFDFAQVLFAGPVNNINQIGIHLIGFSDGGWWGTSGVDSIAAGDLVVPTVQVTSDGGTTWNDVAATSDYIAQISSGSIGGPDALPLATFDFAVQNGINGVRLIGTPGGTASGGVAGFIGATEITVNQIPEPGSLALLGLGGLLIVRRRRRG